MRVILASAQPGAWFRVTHVRQFAGSLRSHTSQDANTVNVDEDEERA